ncbi:MAG: hypothetical protein A3F24_02480 [Candidatus Colwellbacteria bacterium RIFCSPHIGHO2_12_FULL_44_17]|uniref:EfeO-type cupredoxin-like domain-containing protein n=2 Tax=Candidatus Colwelliibacteriota TaxID=1817904 RepID=A0A1G1Z858_9BACT|nr:MAG: hypothetical protein A3F24_02480 [Candidatus Colwellbacteria bacterium RIFCSPHIGHO2_12_FULL_44_17]OGY60825.1 MAG: hypothetical protein A3I31_01455 [Candidatus Colwellbacteria bacterium RIFCSPLOWO2_02_FULL_44_20b]
MNKNLIVGLLVVFIVIIGAVWYSGGLSPRQAEAPLEEDLSNEPVIEGPGDRVQVVTAFTVSGDNFRFSVPEMSVNVGDTVRVTFKNADKMSTMKHDWKVDEFAAATKILSVGEEETIEFVASKAGTFEYYCSVGSHRANGMKGSLTITEVTETEQSQGFNP